MKILQLIPAFYPAFGYGGTVRVAYELSKGLVQRGHDLTVYTTDTYDKSHRIKQENRKPVIIDGIRVYRFRNISNWLAWKRYPIPPSLILTTKRKIKDFDVIHMHGFRSTLSIPIYYYAKKYGIPYILQAHGSVATYFQKGTLKRIFDRLWGYKILRGAAKLIAVTPTEAKQYKSMGVSEDKIEIMPNGIDLSEYNNLPQRGEFKRKYDLNDKQKIVLYLGRIHKIKGLDLLVRAFADLSNGFNNAKLVIVGADDGYLLALKQLVKKLKIEEKVLFTGPLYGEEKSKVYVDADVYVLPSAYEIFGIVVLEACACGTPVIVTDRCGIADMIDGQVGLVVAYNKDALSKAILAILNDDKKRREFGERGKLLVREKFNWEKIAELVENVYLSCLSSRS